MFPLLCYTITALFPASLIFAPHSNLDTFRDNTYENFRDEHHDSSSSYYLYSLGLSHHGQATDRHVRVGHKCLGDKIIPGKSFTVLYIYYNTLVYIYRYTTTLTQQYSMSALCGLGFFIALSVLAWCRLALMLFSFAN